MDINKILKNKYKKNHAIFLERFELENGIKYWVHYRLNNLKYFKNKDRIYYLKNRKKIIERAKKYYNLNKIKKI